MNRLRFCINNLIFFNAICFITADGPPRYFIFVRENFSLVNTNCHSLELDVFVEGTGYKSDSNTLIEQYLSGYEIQYKVSGSTTWVKYLNFILMEYPQHIKTIGLKKNTEYYFRIIGYYAGQSSLLNVIDKRVKNHGPFTTRCQSTLFLRNPRVQQQDNRVYLQWDIDNPDNINDFVFLIRWSNHSKACPENIISNNYCCSRSVKYTQYSEEIDTESYAKYKMSIAIFRENKILQELSLGFETSWRDDINAKEEKLSVRNIKADASSLHVEFDNSHCEKIKGPLFLNVRASAANTELLTCCNTISLKSLSNVKFPTKNNSLVIGNLSSFCKYDVNIFLSRYGNYWENKVLASEFSIPTAPTAKVTREELPKLEANANETTIVITLHQSEECMRGPIVLKYAIFNYDGGNRCNSNAIENPYIYEINSRNQNLEPISIKDLQHSCNYTIRVKAYRFKNESDDDFEYPPMSIVIEASTIIAGKIEDLDVTSQGPDLISLRWLPPPTSTGPLEYRVYINLDTTNFKTIMTPKNCLLWPQYHCYDETIKSPPMASYRFRIFAINKKKKKVIQNEIDEATKLGLYGEVTAENWEKEPDPPYSVGFNYWANGLNVFWNHPNSTYGLVKNFTIWIELQYDKIGSDKIIKAYYIQDRSKYLFQYFSNVNIKQSCRENYKLKQMELCITTHLDKYKSECAKSDIIFPPPPTEYQGNIKFVYEGLKIPRLERDCFLLFYNVYKASVFQRIEAQAELREIMGHLKNNTRYSPSVNTEIYTGNRYDGDHTIPRDILNLTLEAKYIITIVVVNELNGLRAVNFKSVELMVHKMKNEAGHLGILLVVVLIFPIICYFIYRYRRQIIFQTGRLSEDVAVYFATGQNDRTLLRGDSTLHESKENLYYWSMEIPQLPNYSKIISIDNLGDYIKSAIESQELLRQHQMISKTTNIPKSDCGNLLQNKDKNRYNNIVAYDHTRVRLLNVSQDSDYINANYIDGYQFSKAYIAAQGPKPNTVNDFWTMIWENRVEYVVMLCTLYDGNKKNCEQYWPDKDLMEFDGLTIELIINKVLPTFQERKFRIGFNGKSRTITQIHFTSWPPAGQALFPQTLMPLLQKLLTLPYKNNSPILVHCSAGVGRTGTIILCDICLRMAAAKNQVDILNTFERLRKQRPNMVDNIEQYKLAHLAILTSLTASDFLINDNGDFEARVDNMLEDIQIQTQMAYIRDSEWQDDAMKTVASAVQRHVPIVAEKNRFKDILPDEISQVFLQQLPNHDSTSCYINAIHVHSPYTPNRYIVTQQPLSTTLADFWRLLFEQQCTVIVNLTSINDNTKASVPFWPKEGIITADENLHIQLVESRHDKEISLHSLRAIYKPNEFEQSRLKVQILHFNGWPSDNLIPENLEDFVSFVVEFFSIVDNNIQPLIVTCYDGATASGFFVALATLIEQIKTEKCFDLCQIVRTIRVCRKQFVNNEIQFKMLYRAAKIYVNQFGLYDEPLRLLEAQ